MCINVSRLTQSIWKHFTPINENKYFFCIRCLLIFVLYYYGLYKQFKNKTEINAHRQELFEIQNTVRAHNAI